jgi:hypothetical protein
MIGNCVGRVRRLLQLAASSRPELLAAAVSNSWLTVVLSRELEPTWRTGPPAEQLPLALALLLAGTVGGGLAAYGIALNDLVDVRHDRVFARERPLPAGQVGIPTAMVVATVCLLLALFAAVFLGRGSILLCLAGAVGILFYNSAAKFLAPLGILCLAVIWAINMLVPSPLLGFAWPVWLTFSHVIVATTVMYQLGGKRPRLHGPHWWLLWSGWTFSSLLLVGLMSLRDTLWSAEHPWLGVGPGLVAMGTAVTARWWLRTQPQRYRWRRNAAGEFGRLAMLALIAYDAAWVTGVGRPDLACLFIALFILAGVLPRLQPVLDRALAPPMTYQLK